MYCKFIQINLQKIADAINLPLIETINLFSDGRISGELFQRIAIRQFGFIPTKHCQLYDAKFPVSQEKIEIRLITKNGIQTRPSSQIGAGRKFNREAYLQKLEKIDYFLLIDIRTLVKNVPCYLVPASTVRKFYFKKILSKEAGTTSNKTIGKILLESVKLGWTNGLER